MNKKLLKNFVPKKAKQMGKAIVQNLDLPQEVIGNATKMTCISNAEILVENYKALLEYTDLLIRVKTSGKTIKIAGKFLNIDSITDENILITGVIRQIDFIS